LVRISGRDKIVNRPQAQQTVYQYDAKAGSGMYAYVIDTGIYTSHVEFGGRAQWGTSYIYANQPDCSGLNILLNPSQCLFNPNSGGQLLYQDDNGHGTHVSGTIGGESVGVAKQANLIAVKVLNSGGTGSTSDIIAALDWGTSFYASRNLAPLDDSHGFSVPQCE
jgi:subtilisin family serine protease